MKREKLNSWNGFSHHALVAKAKVATQFFQVEGYILTQIRSSIYETIPFVAEGE